MTDKANEAVLNRARQGDASAVGTLYEDYSGPIFRYLYYRCGDRGVAEDLTADVFLRMLKALPDYQPRRVPFRAWIFQIARNLAVDHFRRMSVRNHTGLNESLAARNGNPEATAELQFTSERLREALARLNDDQRDVIVLRFVAGMPISEVSAALDKSESAVKALQYRALRALRTALESWMMIHV